MIFPMDRSGGVIQNQIKANGGLAQTVAQYRIRSCCSTTVLTGSRIGLIQSSLDSCKKTVDIRLSSSPDSQKVFF